MKALSYILAFTIILLSVKPGVITISLSSSPQQSCCSSISSRCSIVANTQEGENHNDHQEIAICNPFQNCGSCLLICENILFYPTLTAMTPVEQNFGYHLSVITSFLSDLWKPPRFVSLYHV